MSDPFANWPNDDLLLQEADQETFRADFPTLAGIFIWPELVEAFKVHERDARPARTRSRQAGVWAVRIGLAGLVMAACSPLLLELTRLLVGKASGAEAGKAAVAVARGPLGALVVVLGLASAAMSYRLLHGQAKKLWLRNRFLCERLRQLPFQVIVNNLDLTAQAISSPDSLARLKAVRAEALADVQRIFKDPHRTDAIFEKIEADHADEFCWLKPEWEAPGDPPAASDDIVLLFQALERQRFDVQETFARIKLMSGPRSATSRAALVANASNVVTVLLLATSVISGLICLTGHAGDDLLMGVVSGLTGTMGAGIAAVRVLADGLQVNTDLERYRWYLASIVSLRNRYRRAPVPQKPYLLREMEELSYQEMRRFIVSATRSRFVI